MNAPPQVPEVTATELKARMDRGEHLVVVDVREPFEREIADLPFQDQLRIPMADLEARLRELSDDGSLDASDTVVLYCRSGSRSAWATRLFRTRGFDSAVNLKGGILAWRSDVDPSLPAY